MSGKNLFINLFGIKQNSTVNVSVSKDLMDAVVFVDPPLNGGKEVDLNDILEALKYSGVIYGIDVNKAEEIVNKKIYLTGVVVASGVLPEDGDNGYIKYSFDLDKVKNGETVLIRGGSVFCTKVLAKDGKKGKNVLGEDIPCDNGEEAQIEYAVNTDLSEDCMHLIASCTGKIQLKNDMLEIVPLSEKEKLGIQENVSMDETSPVDSNLEIYVSDDKLKVIINISPPLNGGKSITVNYVTSILKDRGIVFGIHFQNIIRSIAAKAYFKDIVAAVGSPHIDGIDGHIDFTYEFEDDNIHWERADGSVDFRELGIVHNVNKDDVLCNITYAVSGVSGTDVFGNTIRAKEGKNPVIQCGKNVAFSEDKTSIIASCSGQYHFKNNKIDVFPVFEVDGNVDNSTGNIDFVGNVIIKGDVSDGFSITAGGNITINGMVEGAFLNASGDIKIGTGINCLEKGSVTAGGSITLKFIQNCKMVAGGSIVAESIVNSDIRCGGDLIVVSNKGIIIGGKYEVGGNVTTNTIGSNGRNVNTIFRIGITDFIGEETVVLKERKVYLKKISSELTKKISSLSFRKENSLEENVKSLVDAKKLLIEEMGDIDNTLKEFDEKYIELTRKTISCRNIMHPGTQVSIADFSYNVTQELTHCKLYLDKDEIKFGQFV